MKRAVEVLGPRALNRALLERQHLLRRCALPATAVVEHLVGMQAQTPNSPYLGLWSRMAGFRPAELSEAMLTRKVVRIVLMRSTIHLVTAADALALRPVLQAALERYFHKGSPFGRAVVGMDFAELVAAARELLDAAPRTTAAAGNDLQKRWPERDAIALGNAVRSLVPLVQLPPRGVWGAGGPPVWATAEAWLGRSLATQTAPEETILRYLAAFGPASVQDVQAWSGLTRLGDVVERLRPRLRVFADEGGRELFDVKGGPLPDPGTPAPPRFLPDFDNLLLSHADRARIMSEADRKRFSGGGPMIPTILVDGFVGGTWKIDRRRNGSKLTILPFKRLLKADRAPWVDEGERLLAFLAGDAGTREVAFA